MRTKLPLFACAMCALAVAVLGGATAATGSVQTTCAGALCVTVEDVDGVSPSTLGPPAVIAYQVYKITLTNTGSAPIPGGTIAVLLSDIVSDKASSSNAEFTLAGSSPGCARISQAPNLVRCSVGGIAGNSSSPVLLLSYRTTRTPGVTATNANVNVSLGAVSVSATERTDLENDPESAAAWSPPGRLTQIATSPADDQFSTLQYSVPTNRPGFVSGLEESGGRVCPGTVTCLGELVTTDLADAALGTFSPSNLFHLTLNLPLSAVPPTASLSNLFLWHRLDNGTFEKVRTRCQTSPPAASSALPCIRVAADQLAGRLIIDAWGFQNGGWQPGL
jgi:hypothetical protein